MASAGQLVILNPWELLCNEPLDGYGHEPVFVPLPNVHGPFIVREWVLEIYWGEFPGTKSDRHVTVEGLILSLLCGHGLKRPIP